MKKDTTAYYFAGAADEIKYVFNNLKMPYADSSRDKKWAGIFREKDQPVIKAKNLDSKQVPDVKGMGLKDALYALESRDIHVSARGTGKVKQQSIAPGTVVSKNQNLILDLN